MHRMLLPLAGLSLAAAAPAGAASAGNAENPDAKPAAAAAEAAKAEPKICRKIESTESRAKRTRVCLTREEWKKADRTN